MSKFRAGPARSRFGKSFVRSDSVNMVRVTIVFVASLLVVACGGGGGAAPATAPASITATVVNVPIPSIPPAITPTVIGSTGTMVTPTVPVQKSLLPQASDAQKLVVWLAPVMPGNYEYLTSGDLVQATSTLPATLRANAFGYVGFGSDTVNFVLSVTDASYVDAVTNPNRYIQNILVSNVPREEFQVFTSGRGCNTSRSFVFIHELRTDANGFIDVLAFDFIVDCSGNPIHNLRGGVRSNSSVPLLANKVFGSLDVRMQTREARPLVLDGDFIFHSLDTVLSTPTYAWSQLSGVPMDLSPCIGLARCLTFGPKVSKGGSDIVLALDVSVASTTLRKTVLVNVLSHQDRQSRVEVFGAGAIAGGGAHSIIDQDAQFSVILKRPLPENSPELQAINKAYIEYAGLALERPGQSSYGSISIEGPASLPLQPTNFTTAYLGPSMPAGYSFDFAANSTSGAGVVLAKLGTFDRDSSDLTKINSMAIVFDYYSCAAAFCEVAPTQALFWINHTPVNPPLIRLVAPTTIRAGGQGVSTCANTAATSPGAHSYIARQLKGPSVGLTIDSSGVVRVAPPAGTTSAYQVVIACEMIDNKANTGADLAVINIIP